MRKSLILVFSFLLIFTFSYIVQARTPYEVPEKFIEVPMLEEDVEKGDLPPIEDRVPDEPFVIGPGVLNSEEWLDWESGNYGGTVRVPDIEGSHEMMLSLGTTILRAPDQSTEDPEPAIVSDYEISDDYKTFTLTIREGLKWSDGEPVTTEDVRFTYEDIYLNEDVGEIPPSILHTQGNPDNKFMEVEIIDEYTFEISFDKPYGWFLAELSSWIPDYTQIFKPSHYLKQFHIDYTSEEEIEPYLEEEELDEWYEILDLKDINHWEMQEPYAVDVPVLTPWKPVKITSNVMEFERNPYYWKVDKEGKQLPYFDKVVSPAINEYETMNMKVISGELDIVTSYAQIQNMALYRENEEKGNYRTVMHGSINNPPLLFLNHDFEYDKEDSTWQNIIKNHRQEFGEALALAIDSEDVNNNLYFGRFDMPEITTAEYNPEKAREILDSIGMDKFDDEDFRLGPDGEEFDFVISVAAHNEDIIPMTELLKSYFEDVGIRTTIDQMGVRIWNQRKDNNELMASVFWNDGPIWPPGISVDYLPNHKGPWATASWNYYNTRGESGRKPPEYIQDFLDIHDARKEVPPESEKGKELYQELVNWFEDNYVMIFPIGNMQQPTIVSNDIGNVIKDGYPFDRACDYGMEQLFYKE